MARPLGALAATVIYGITLFLAPPVQAQEWSVDAEHASSTLLEYTATEGTWISVDVSPDGRHIAFDLLGHIFEMPIGGGEAVVLTEGRSWNAFPRYSPDGSRIAYTSDRGGSNDLWVLDRRGGGHENVSRMGLPVHQGTWSRDGRHLYGTALDMKVSFPLYKFNFFGTRQELGRMGGFQPANHLQEHPHNGLVYFEHNDQQVYRSGARIKTYDLETGEIEVYIQRPGGAFNPRLSPDGRYLAYVHRSDLETVLVVHDLETRRERVVFRGLHRDRQEVSFGFYGAFPNMAWTPDGAEIVVTVGGGIHAVDVESGATRNVPFRAPVRRELDETMRFPVEVPDGAARTLSHRWAHRTERGILFEALGDIYLWTGNGEGGAGDFRKLTRTPALETSPVFDPDTGMLYYASWTDDDMGNVYSLALGSGGAGGMTRRGASPTRLTDKPAQYGSLTLSADGRQFAFVRGVQALMAGRHLEQETAFELMVVGPDGAERKVTDLTWSGNM